MDFTEIEAGFDPEKRQRDDAALGPLAPFRRSSSASSHIGGCDDMMALERAGKLDPLLAAA